MGTLRFDHVGITVADLDLVTDFFTGLGWEVEGRMFVEGEFLDVDTLTAQPFPLQTLVDEGFRATRIATGDSISAAISQEGELRVWGSFRVSDLRHTPVDSD